MCGDSERQQGPCPLRRSGVPAKKRRVTETHTVDAVEILRSNRKKASRQE